MARTRSWFVSVRGKQKDALRSLGASFSVVWSVLLEGVLDLLAGLLQIAFGLVGLALGPQALIDCGSACRFLALTADPLCGVLNLCRPISWCFLLWLAAVRMRHKHA
jgi:hypothetical protein